MKGLGFRGCGLGSGIWGLGVEFRIWGSGSRVWDLELRV